MRVIPAIRVALLVLLFALFLVVVLGHKGSWELALGVAAFATVFFSFVAGWAERGRPSRDG
jgi:hypothetical protein